MPEINYIAVEGPIASGKTSLARLLAEKLKAGLILEEVEENPFLADFYRDQRRYAFQTQIYFLLSRFRQQSELLEMDLFYKKIVSDYFFGKDKIFALLNLDEKEGNLYQKIVQLLEKNISQPDLIIYLQSSSPQILDRIRLRKKTYEINIQPEYIDSLIEAYNHFFFHYDNSPVLVVNTAGIDFVNNSSHLEDLLEQVNKPFSGTRYYTPVNISKLI